MSGRPDLAAELPYGLRLDTGRMVHVEEVLRGLQCDCVCPACRQPLVAHQGSVRVWHFQHKGDAGNCRGGRETALHEAAKQIIIDAGSLIGPRLVAKRPDGTPQRVVQPGQRITLVDAHDEARSLPGVVPDVLATVDGAPFIIEVHVHHKVDERKQAKLRALGIPTMEIHLTVYRGMQESTYRDAVLRTALRDWLWHPRQAEVDAALAQDMAAAAAAAEETRRQDEARRVAQEMRAGRSPVIAYAKPFSGPVRPSSFWESDRPIPPVVACSACRYGSWWSPQTRDPATPGQRAWICVICHPPPPGRAIDRTDFERIPADEP